MKSAIALVIAMAGLLQAQPNVTVTVMPYKDGWAADDLTKNGTNSDLAVKAGGPKTWAWMTFRMTNISAADRASLTSATLTLYVKSVTTAGKIMVRHAPSSLPTSESGVAWSNIS